MRIEDTNPNLEGVIMMKKTVMMVAAAMGISSLAFAANPFRTYRKAIGPMRPLRNFQVPASLRHTLIVRLRGSAP